MSRRHACAATISDLTADFGLEIVADTVIPTETVEWLPGLASFVGGKRYLRSITWGFPRFTRAMHTQREAGADRTGRRSHQSDVRRDGARHGLSLRAKNAVTALFGGTLVDDIPALLPGLPAAPDLIAAAAGARLIIAIDREALSPFEFQGWLGKRLTTSFGFHYGFERGQFAATDPIPDWLAPIKARATAFAGVPDDDLVQALLIRYDHGAGSAGTRPSGVRACRRHIARRARDTAAAAANRQGGRQRCRPTRAAFALSPDRRSPPRLGTQHRRDGRDALVDHLSQLFRKGSARDALTCTTAPRRRGSASPIIALFRQTGAAATARPPLPGEDRAWRLLQPTH